MGYGPYGMMGYGSGWGSGAGMMLFWTVLLVLLIAGAVWLIRGSSRGSGPSLPFRSRPAGLDSLDEGYARGKINREEYLQRKRDILGQGERE